MHEYTTKIINAAASHELCTLSWMQHGTIHFTLTNTRFSISYFRNILSILRPLKITYN